PASRLRLCLGSLPGWQDQGDAPLRFAGAAPHSAAPWVSTGAFPPTSLMTLTIFWPSLSCAPVTVILSPAFKVFAFQPKLNSLCGEAVSATHFSALPL